ncbi:MAG TPA: type II secretion system major pseudopilin GspG [Gammaproteobacteria bacterium]|nr:type II secretion system major pseudopilin GspG [Gammaproteobacteria bacterium]
MHALQRKRQGGFTLIEVMVVVMILGILAAIVVPRIVSRPEEAKIVKAKQDIARIEAALDLYRLDNGMYPTQQQGLQSLVTKPNTPPLPSNWQSGGYINRLPTDPWGAEYQYDNPGQHGEIDIYSLGSGQDTEGAPAEIGNW